MYNTILVTLEGTPTDRAIIDHIKPLAKLLGSRVVLLHVATGATAQYHGSEAAGREVEEGKDYLARVRLEMNEAGVRTEAEMAYGEPAKQIVNWVNQKGCDLIAMSTHGHQMLADLFLGTTAIRVQHSVKVPVLLLRAK
jgi:universal stress protein A